MNLFLRIQSLPGYLIAHMVWLAPILTAVGYYFGAKLGVKASIMSEGIAIFWPPNAVLLAAQLLSPPRRWPILALAIVPAEILADLPTFSLKQALMFASVNILETTLAAVLLKYSIGLPVKLDRLRHVAWFGLSSLVLASGTAALLGAAVYVATSDRTVSYWANWRIWWFGDGLGLLIVVPVLLGWLQKQSDTWHVSATRRRTEAAALLAVTVMAGLWIFSQPAYLTNQFPASPLLLLPSTIWAAVRFGIRGAASINLLIAVVSIYGTINRQGPFISLQQADNVLQLQEYLAALAFSSLALAALLQELRMQNDRLRVLARAVEAVHEGILIADARAADNPIIFANKGFERISGYAADEVIGKNPRFLLDDSSDPLELQKIRKAIRQRRQVRSILKNRRKDGTVFYNQIIIDPVPDESGNIGHFIGIQHDITELIEKEEALRAAHQELENINRDLESRIEQRTEELKQANEQLENLAATDPLTGAYNRRHFMIYANEEFERTVRHRRSLSVVAIDIDHFKTINDRYGHRAGDKILIALTETVIGILRPADMLARFGGEEFFILLPDTSLGEAVRVAERLKDKIIDICVTDDKGNALKFTASFGIATLGTDTPTIELLLEYADQALYDAKNAGRNCIRSAA